MSFRARLTLYVAAAIAVTVAAASVAVWVVAKHELLTQFDQTLFTQATEPHHGGPGPGQYRPTVYTTFVLPDGTKSDDGNANLPVSARALAVARGSSLNNYFTTTTVSGIHLCEFV